MEDPRAARVLALFRDADVDGNGTIDPDELKTILVKLGMTEDEANTAFANADANRDGLVDFEEFFAWVVATGAPAEVKASLEGGGDLEEARAGIKKIVLRHFQMEMAEWDSLYSTGKLHESLKNVFFAITLLLDGTEEWRQVQSKVIYGRPQALLDDLHSFDPDSVTPETVEKLDKYTRDPSFTKEQMEKRSDVAPHFCVWVLAVQAYCRGK